MEVKKHGQGTKEKKMGERKKDGDKKNWSHKRQAEIEEDKKY